MRWFARPLLVRFAMIFRLILSAGSALVLSSCASASGIAFRIIYEDEVQCIGIVREAFRIEGVQDSVVLIHGGVIRLLDKACRLIPSGANGYFMYNLADSCRLTVEPGYVCMHNVEFFGYDSGVRIHANGCAKLVRRPEFNLSSYPASCTEDTIGFELCQDERGQLWLRSEESIWRSAKAPPNSGGLQWPE